MIIVIGILFAALLAGGLLIIFFAYRFERPLAFGLGLLTGCALSVLKVILLEKAFNKAVDMGKEKAPNYARLQAVLRYGLTIVVMLGAVVFPRFIGLFGIIAGILSLQLASYITGFLRRKNLD